jgi:hypothetical protein
VEDIQESVVGRAKKRFDEIAKNEQQLRKEGLEDLKFRAGKQWSEGVRADRELPGEERPLLTINKSRRYINLIVNDGRMQRPQIRVRAAGGPATDRIAQLLEDHLRAIQMDSRADLAYDCGLEWAATIGWGYWRIITEYEAHNSFNQILKIIRIADPFSVYLDPQSESDGTGARYAFIMGLIDKKDLESEYPDRTFVSWEGSSPGDADMKRWYDGDSIRVAEYFEIEEEIQTLYQLEDGLITWTKPADDALIAVSREVNIPVVHWYKLTAATDEPLEHQQWIGEEIPIVRMVGEEYRLEGRTVYEGVIRHAKDAMKIYNYWATSLTEQVAMAPKTPYLAAAGQIERYSEKWKAANVRPQAVLPYDPVSIEGHPVPPPIKVPAPEVSTGILAALQIADKDIMDTVGFYQANTGEPSNEQSGVAITNRQKQGELGTSHYLDNWGRSLVRTGRLLLSLIPLVYDTPRMLRALGEDDHETLFEVDTQQEEPIRERLRDGRKIMQVNPAIGRYDVSVQVGPTFQTRRQEAAAGMIEFIKVVPNIAQVTADLIVKNMDWPGSEEFRDRLEKLLPPGMLTTDASEDTPQIRSAKNQIQAAAQQLQQQAQQLQQAQQQIEQVNAQREKELSALEFKAFKEKAQAELKELRARFTNQVTQLRQQLVREKERAVGHVNRMVAQRVVQQ